MHFYEQFSWRHTQLTAYAYRTYRYILKHNASTVRMPKLSVTSLRKVSFGWIKHTSSKFIKHNQKILYFWRFDLYQRPSSEEAHHFQYRYRYSCDRQNEPCITGTFDRRHVLAHYKQEAQLSPSDREMRLVSSNLANYHATVQKLLIWQVLTKPMVWSWRFSWRQCVINKPTTVELCISPVYRRLAVAKFSKSTM